MDAEEILGKVHAKDPLPEGWFVFSLKGSKIFEGIITWLVGIVVGTALLAFILPIVIPFNYQRGIIAAVFTTLILVMVGFIALGSLYLLVVDLVRWLQRDRHKVVVTDKDFVKQEGASTIHVPLSAIKYVTPRGRAPIDRTPPPKEETSVKSIPSLGESLFNFIFGREANAAASGGSKQRRKRMRTPSSLAFLDTRTDREVIVVNDLSYGDPFYIAAILKQHVAAVQPANEQEAQIQTERKHQ